MHPQGPSPSQDVSQAAWILPRLDDRPSLVGAVVPSGYEAYARVLHPALDQPNDELVRWAQVAVETGRTVHSLVQWHRLVGTDDALNFHGADWDRAEPDRGNLYPTTLAALLQVLARHTSTPDDAYFCLWEGYGWINPQPGSTSMTIAVFGEGPPPQVPAVEPAFPPEVLAGPRVRLGGEKYLLLHGPLDAALLIGEQITPDWFEPQSPNLFWPQDRAWCVGTDIDFDSTIVGGSTRLIDDLLASPDLEAWPVRPQDSLAFDADQLN